MNGETDAKRRLLPLPEGTLIAGKYVVGRLLASGGMGIVAEGRHLALDQRIAIKFLLPEIADNEEAVYRFLREARSAARIESDHIVRVFDVGVHDDLPYMVMEYLDGTDLGLHAERAGPLPVAEALDIVIQALDGLAQAHQLGIVHRDLKPANLFVVERGDRGRARRVKILDFGISKLIPASPGVETGLTSTKSLLGSPGYMSPEQVRSTKNVDARTDVWSMGVIFYELLIGELAFSGETIGDVFAKIREEPLPPIREWRPDVPVGLAEVIMKCLERDRDRRYQGAGELLEALLPFQDAAPQPSFVTRGSAPRLRVADAQTCADAPTLSAEQGEDPPPAKPPAPVAWSTGGRSGPTKRWTIGGVSLLAVVGLAAMLWPSRAAPPTVPPALPIAASPGASAPSAGALLPPELGVARIEVVPSAIAVEPSMSAGASASAPVPSAAPPRREALPPGAPRPSALQPAKSPPPAVSVKKKKDDLGI